MNFKKINIMNITGKIEFISPIQLVGEKQHKKQYFIISDEKGDYPNKLKIEAFNKSEEMDGLKVGSIVEVLYNATVNEYKGTHYGALSLYKIVKSSTAPTEVKKAVKTQESDPFQNGNSGDLPF